MRQVRLEFADDAVDGGLEIGVFGIGEVLEGACCTEILLRALHEEVADHETGSILPGGSMSLEIVQVCSRCIGPKI